MTPTIGRIVLYRITPEEADKTNQRREDARQQFPQMQRTRPGFQAHIGNPVSGGEVVPMIVTQVWPNEFGPDRPGVNGQAFLDGSDSLWVASVEEGDGAGQWSWPPRV